MAILNVGQTQKVLDTGAVQEWTSKVNKIDLETGFGTQLEKTSSKTFGEFLQDSINKVNDIQLEANKAIQKLATGESKNIHETMLMVEQAEIAFKTMNQIRSKVLEAYKEIMRMQI